MSTITPELLCRFSKCTDRQARKHTLRRFCNNFHSALEYKLENYLPEDITSVQNSPIYVYKRGKHHFRATTNFQNLLGHKRHDYKRIQFQLPNAREFWSNTFTAFAKYRFGFFMFGYLLKNAIDIWVP